MEITLDRKEMKREAREAMRAAKPWAGWVTLAAIAIIAVLELLSVKLEFPGKTLREIALAYWDETEFENMLIAGVAGQSFISRALSFAVSVMNAVVIAGYTGYTMNVARSAPAGFGDLFDAFEIFLKVLVLNILENLFIALWSLLLIIPGIIAAYRYSMAIYILLDDPDKSVMDCIRESKEMTMGHKGELFVLDLSFLGWALLSVIPFVSLYSIPYMMVTRANYYRNISGRYSAPWVDSGAPDQPEF